MSDDDKAHKWVHTPTRKKSSTYPWAICDHCGLVRLKNAISAWAAKQSCGEYKDTPEFQKFIRTGKAP
jgi:hypothetical protein